MTKNINDFVFDYVPWKKELGYKADDSNERCRHDAYDSEIRQTFQCARNAKQMIQGYGFCTQHAKMVKKELGINES